ncbi:MAG: ABC transporter permease subunit [Bacilli bacterium]|jgi:ABC-2 type transport system permease protein|nr:ABC transporter permease subunit [Acholeplasmataceae bacterium]
MLNLHVLRMELKRSLNGLLGWSLAVGIFIYAMLVMYPLVEDLYSQVSEELLDLLDVFGGIPKNEIDYFAIEIGLLLQLFGAIFAALTGFNLISREEREQTADLIYSLPVSRTAFFFTKLTAALIQALLFTIIVTLFSVLGFLSVNNNLNLSRFFIYMALFLLLLVLIAFLGAALACFLKRSAKSTIALIIPLPLYLFTFFSSLTKNEILKKIKYISPFTFSDPLSFLKLKESFEWLSFAISGGISLALIIAAMLLFRKREFTN